MSSKRGLPLTIEEPSRKWIEVDNLEDLERLRAEWKRDVIKQVADNVVKVLYDEGCPRDQIAAIAERSVLKVYEQIAGYADAAAAEIERDILAATQH